MAQVTGILCQVITRDVADAGGKASTVPRR